jgi:hypothetical protein
MDSIFRNTNFYTLSDPQPTWLFDVSFYSVSDDDNNHGSGFIEIFNKYLIITSVSLPSHTTEIVTKKYFGSEKSFPVIRKYGGDCSMQFDIRTEPNETLGLEKLAQIDALYHVPGDDYIRYHPELNPQKSYHFEKIIVRLIDKSKSAKPPENLTNVTDLTNRQRELMEYYGIQSEYEFNNCILTEFSFGEGLDYSSESKLTGKMTFHYDMWHKTWGYDKATKHRRVTGKNLS